MFKTTNESAIIAYEANGGTIMDYHKLQGRINELAKEINYPCKKTDHLVYAMKLSTVPGHIFFHSGFEAVGKALVDAVNTHYLFTRGYHTEKDINEAKKQYLAKGNYVKFAKDHSLWKYVYNDELFADEAKRGMMHSKDNDETLVYRIIGSMYYDSGWEVVKDWIINNLGIRVMKKTGSIEGTK